MIIPITAGLLSALIFYAGFVYGIVKTDAEWNSMSVSRFKVVRKIQRKARK